MISLVIVFNAVLVSIYKQLTIIVHAIRRLICLKKPFKRDFNRWIYSSRRGTPQRRGNPWVSLFLAVTSLRTSLIFVYF